MTQVAAALPIGRATPATRHAAGWSPGVSQGLLLLAAGLAAGAGFLATGAQPASAAIANAGTELTHLLRAMALLKLLFAAAATAVTLWRLASPVAWPRLAAYAAGCAAMAAGPGLIWNMAHVQAGAILLHGGLIATVVMLWRDPATAARLNAAIAAHRAQHR